MSRAQRIYLAAFCGAAVTLVGVGDRTTASAAERGVKSYGIPQVEMINELIRKGWTDRELAPSQMVSDSEWCRRVYLDVIGRIPSGEELAQFLGKDKGDKQKLIDRLLDDDKYTEEYARNWAQLWSVTLIGRPKGARDEMRSLVSREGMSKWLRDAFARNMPYDKFVSELVTATGATTPGSEPGDDLGHKMKFNGATNFLVGNMEEGGLQATAKTAQIFLGMQVQCTQCHNHPFNEYKQNQFWEFNAFFRQTHAHKIGTRRNVDSAELKDDGFKISGMDEDKKAREVEGERGEVYYEMRNGKMGSAYPVFVDGRQLHEVLKLSNPSDTANISQANRRKELAKMILSSEYMAKIMVNRTWAHFNGYGFTKPIDDMGPHNQPTHPELLDRLAKEFAGEVTVTTSETPSAGTPNNSRYDVKQLIKWIVLSEPYALSSKFNARNKQDDPSIGEKPAFSHFYLRQMRAEELYESLLVATRADAAKSSVEQREATKNEWLKQFTIAFGTDEGDDTTTFNGSIPQILMMMNGDLVKKASSVDQGGYLHSVASANGDNTAKINALYMAGLARKPTNGELQAASGLLAAKRGNVVGALQDIWWSILNSNEFILNH